MFLLLCPVEKKYTTDLLLCLFAVCQKTHTRQRLCRVPNNCHASLVAVRLLGDTRQRLRHTANMPFRVGSRGEVTTDETLLTSGDFVPVVLCGDGIECIDTMGKGSN